MALNYLAGKLNLKYDHKGELAAQGEINNPLLEQLNALPFYQQEGPKSLGKEWFDKNFLPLLNRPEDKSEDAISNTLRTVTEHIALQHASVLKKTNIKGPVLLTGGGAFNEFLVNRLKAVCDAEIHIPDADVINFKEAIIFALLGWLYSRNEINTLSSATGSKRNSIGGALYKGL